MRIGWRAVLVLLAGVLVIAGCGSKVPSNLSSADKQAFESAPPDIKEVWLHGVEAFRTNDYVTAQTLFYSLLNQDLSPAQRKAVANQSTILMNRLYEGAQKNDPAALKAFEELRRNPPNRQPR